MTHRSLTAAIGIYLAARDPRGARAIDAGRRPKATRCTGTRARPCSSRRWHESRRKGHVCASCGKPWPTQLLGGGGSSQRRASRIEETRQIAAAEVGLWLSRMTVRSRVVLVAWVLATRVSYEHRSVTVHRYLTSAAGERELRRYLHLPRYPRDWSVWGVRQEYARGAAEVQAKVARSFPELSALTMRP